MSPQPQQQGPQQGQQQESPQSLAEGLLRGPVTIGKRGVEINDTHDAWRFANIAFQSRIVPKSFPNVASVMIAVMMGAELGMTPMASIQNIAVINGRPSLWGDIMLALCRQSGKFDEEVFLEEYFPGTEGGACSCIVRRKPDGQTIVQQFSMEDAKQAKLQDKDNWKTYPKRMLMFRARSWALRDAFGDVLLGLRSAEEERDIPDDVPAEEPVSSLEELTAKLEKQTEAGDLPYSCAWCGFSASYESDVREHVKTCKRRQAEEPEVRKTIRSSGVADRPEPIDYEPEPEPAEDPIADPPCDPPIGGEEEAAEAADKPDAMSNAERRSAEDRHFREFSQALADAESASEVARLIAKLEQFNNKGLLAGLDYLALKQEADACKRRLSQ